MKKEWWTEARIHERCTEDGDCLTWSATTDRGWPYACVGRGKYGVRNLLFTDIYGLKLNPGRAWQPNCGNPACLAKEHMTQVTRSEVQRRIAKREMGTVTGRMRRERCTAGWQKLGRLEAIEIRLSDEKTSVLAERYGTTERTIQRCRAGKTWVMGAANSVFALGAA